MAGCNTLVSNIVMAMVTLLTLLVITPLFKYTPNAVISAIIISAVAGLIDIPAAIRIWKVDKLDFLALMGAFIGVIFKSVEIGLLIAVSIHQPHYFYFQQHFLKLFDRFIMHKMFPVQYIISRKKNTEISTDFRTSQGQTDRDQVYYGD